MKPKLEKRIAALESKRISQSFIVFIVPAGATDDCTVAYEYDGCTIHREVGEPLDALKARITEVIGSVPIAIVRTIVSIPVIGAI